MPKATSRKSDCTAEIWKRAVIVVKLAPTFQVRVDLWPLNYQNRLVHKGTWWPGADLK